MAKKTQDKVISIRPDTPEMENYLALGYDGLTVEEAERIIKERKANPQSHPYEVMKKCEAFLAAYHTAPKAIDTQPGWKRKLPEEA